MPQANAVGLTTSIGGVTQTTEVAPMDTGAGSGTTQGGSTGTTTIGVAVQPGVPGTGGASQGITVNSDGSITLPPVDVVASRAPADTTTPSFGDLYLQALQFIMPSAEAATLTSAITTLAPKYENFFNQLYAPALKIANGLHTRVEFILGLAAYESGYFSDGHDVGLNNPWGLTQAGGATIAFNSLQAAADSWEQNEGWRFTDGPQTKAAFMADLMQPQTGTTGTYNSANPNYASTLSAVIDGETARLSIWFNGHPQ